MTTALRPNPVEPQDAGIHDAGREPWVRHPADIARAVFAALVALGFSLVVAAAPEGVAALTNDFVALVANIPAAFVGFVVGLVQLLALVAPVAVAVVLLVRRRVRELGVLALAAAIAALAIAILNSWLATKTPSVVLEHQRADSWFTGAAFPSTAYLGAFTAVVAASSPWLHRSWRLTAYIAVAVVAITRVLTATEVPIGVCIVIACGAAAGSIALLITGAPRRSVDPGVLRAALAHVGVTVGAIEEAPGRHHGPAFRARGDSGEIAIDVVGRDERDTAMLLRSWRSLTKKGLGDHRPVRSPRRAAEHEMTALALASAAGALVPTPLAVAYTEDEAALVVTAEVRGEPLAVIDPAALDDARLVDAWRQISGLHARRIAHRALDAEHVYCDSTAALVDFSVATLDASDEVCNADVANLLVSTAVVVGVDRAVNAAHDGLGTDALAAALPLLQPTVLTPYVRHQIAGNKGLVGEVRTATQQVTGVDNVELAKIPRITVKGVLSLVGGLVLGLYALYLIGNWSEIWDSLKEVTVGACVLLLIFMVGNYVGGTISLMGAVPTNLPFVRTLDVMFGQSFLNRFTPCNAGGMVLRARYLQLEGTDLTAAAAAVGLTSAASGVAQVVLIVVFFVWAGTTDQFGNFSMPDIGVILVIVIIVAAIAGAVLLSGWGRRVVWPIIKRTAGKAFGLVRELSGRPGKVALLFGGATFSKLSTILAFAVSVHAFGVDMPLAQCGALYLIANTIGSAVPTPGGVGGIEAALTAVLIGAGVDNVTAGAIVVLFRFFTYWLPTLPGYIMLQYVQKAGIV